MHDIPESTDQSFYRGTTYFYIKIHATEPSSPIRNATETANALIGKYGGGDNVPPMLNVYTNSGPERCSNFMSVQITMIALQCFLDLDILIAARTAQRHS